MIDLEIPEDSVPDPTPGGGSFPYGITTDGNRLVYVDYTTKEVFASDIGGFRRLCRVDVAYPKGLYFFEDQYFILSRGRMYLLNIETGETELVFDVRSNDASEPNGIALDRERVYVSDKGNYELRIYRRSDFSLINRVHIKGNLRELLVHDNVLWLLDSKQKLVVGFHPESGERLRSFFAPDFATLRGLTVLDGLWWFTDKNTNSIIPTRVQFLSNAIRSNPRLLRISFVDEIENRYPKDLRSLSCRMAIPFSTLNQEIFKLEITRPDRIDTDMYQQRVAFFEFRPVEAGGRREIGFDAVARLWDVRYGVEDVPLKDLEKIEREILDLYTVDHEMLRQTDPIINRALKEISVERNSLKKTLWNIRNYIHDHLEYVRDGRHDPAPVVLSRGSGSCTEYSLLFLAIARALRIPTRFGQGSSGKYADEREVYVDKIFHRWVEVYFPRQGWFPIDANKDDSKSRDYSERHFLAYDWKVFHISSRFIDGGEYLKKGIVVYHRWSRGENRRQDGRLIIQKQAEWRLVPGYY
jgi:hypothetical protein